MKSRRGAALVEMAFALLIVMPALAAGMGWARAWATLHDLESACREGARFASTYPVDSASPDHVRAAVIDRVLAAAPNLRAEHVVVDVGMQSGRPREVRVSIRGYRLSAPGAAWVLDGKPAATFPWRGPANVSTRTARETAPAVR